MKVVQDAVGVAEVGVDDGLGHAGDGGDLVLVVAAAVVQQDGVAVVGGQAADGVEHVGEAGDAASCSDRSAVSCWAARVDRDAARRSGLPSVCWGARAMTSVRRTSQA